MYVFWRDPSSGVSGWTRVAQQPNQRAASTFACVALPSGVRYRHFELGDLGPGERADGAWSGRGQRWWWDGDDLRVSYDSEDCGYELVWRGFYAPVDFHALLATFVEDLGEINAEHIEQSGTVSGRVRVADEEIEVDALGHRDHSWGHRDTGRLLASRWMIGTAGPELSWSGVAVVMADGRRIDTGFVVRDRSVVPVTGLDVTLATKEDGLSYTSADSRFELLDGTSLAVSLRDVTIGGVLEVPPWVGIEASAAADADGRAGVGNCETANNITGGSTAPPVLVTGGAVGQGVTGRAGGDRSVIHTSRGVRT